MKLLNIAFILAILCGGYLLLYTDFFKIVGSSVQGSGSGFDIYSIGNGNLSYDTSQIQEEVISQMELYFEGVDFNGFTINDYQDMGWEGSGCSYTPSTKYSEIDIGLIGIENKESWYKLIFTHEYMHYILFSLNLTDDETQEGIADVYSRFTNLEASKEMWGKYNQKRNFPYSIITNKVIDEREEDCLKKIFDEEDKINNLEEIHQRLILYCNFSQEYLTENSVDWD